MKRPTTHLGNKELHRRHMVVIEWDVVPRSRVLDQHLIDKYLLRKVITLRQHHAGEHLLQQAAAAGVWATGVNWSGKGAAAANPNYVPFGAFWFGGTMRFIREQLGHAYEYVTRAVICTEADAERDPVALGLLRDSLDLVADVRGGDSMRTLRNAVQKRMSAN